VWERLLSRREAMRRGVVAGLAAGSLPLALAALARPAYAQAPASVLAVLNFALTLEYLEAEFYNIATGATAIPAASSSEGTGPAGATTATTSPLTSRRGRNSSLPGARRPGPTPRRRRSPAADRAATSSRLLTGRAPAATTAA